MWAVVPLRVVVSIVLVLWAIPARGQDAPAPPAPPATQAPVPSPSSTTAADAPAVDEAPLVYFNRTITVFRVPLFGVAPQARARRSAEVLGQLLDRASAGIVTVQAEPQGNLILIDSELAFILVEGDADRLSGETLATLTERTLATLRLVIAETREIRDRSRLLRSALHSLVGTLIFVAVVALRRNRINRKPRIFEYRSKRPDRHS